MLVAQSCLTVCDPVDCSFPGFSVHGVLQARILEWGSLWITITGLPGTLSAPLSVFLKAPQTTHSRKASDPQLGAEHHWCLPLKQR